jgi:predicted DCC family thiol-disulfide oxidoreductase YuxK
MAHLVSNGTKDAAPAGTATTQGGVILFDGECAFCEGAVVFIARRDPAAYFRFGASQSPRSAALLSEFGLTRETARSIILIEGGQAYLRSTASLRIAARLTWPWSMARVFLWVPAIVRDAVYGVVAAVRVRLAGRSNACQVPPPEIRARMI